LIRLTGRRRRVGAALIGIAALVAPVAVLAQPAGAAGETVTVNGSNPATGLLNGQVVSVVVTTTQATGAGVFVAVTQCGNANSSGTPLATLDASGGDCAGQSGLGTTLQLLGFPTGNLAAGTNTTSLTLQETGLGTLGAQCIPSPPATLPCTITAATATTAGSYTGPGYNFQAAAVIVYRPAPTASITSITGQTGTAAARAGNVINLTGSNWDATSTTVTGTLALCDTTGATCDATGLTSPSFSVTGGTLTASATVDPSATAGARAVKVSESSGLSALVPITILGARSITLSPPAGGAGTNVSITGSGFNASVPLVISGLTSASAPTTDPPVVTDTSSASGGVAASFTVNDPNTASIVVAEASAPTTNFALASFSFSGNQCTPAGQVTGTGATTGGPDANPSTSNGCNLLQTVTQQINGGVLTFAQATGQVTMGTVVLSGADQTSTGNISQLTVTDARGSLNGWTVNAVLSDLAGPLIGSHHTIPAANMTDSNVTCAPQSASTGLASDVAAGTAGAFSNTVALTLCTAAAGGGGGTFNINSALSLLVPASVAAGTYTGTMTFTVT